jgi:hypothetical protein
MGIKITLDTREFEALLNSAAGQIPRAMRSVVSKVARNSAMAPTGTRRVRHCSRRPLD